MLSTIRRIVAALVACLSLPAQNLPVPPGSAAVQRIKERVGEIAIGGKLTVRKLDGTEYHGRLQAVDDQQLSVREVDLGQVVTVPFAEIEHVSKDYGGKGFGGRRVNPHRSRIIGLAVVAGLLTIVFVAVAADKS